MDEDPTREPTRATTRSADPDPIGPRSTAGRSRPTILVAIAAALAAVAIGTVIALRVADLGDPGETPTPQLQMVSSSPTPGTGSAFPGTGAAGAVRSSSSKQIHSHGSEAVDPNGPKTAESRGAAHGNPTSTHTRGTPTLPGDSGDVP